MFCGTKIIGKQLAIYKTSGYDPRGPLGELNPKSDF